MSVIDTSATNVVTPYAITFAEMLIEKIKEGKCVMNPETSKQKSVLEDMLGAPTVLQMGMLQNLALQNDGVAMLVVRLRATMKQEGKFSPLAILYLRLLGNSPAHMTMLATLPFYMQHHGMDFDIEGLAKLLDGFVPDLGMLDMLWDEQKSPLEIPGLGDNKLDHKISYYPVLRAKITDRNRSWCMYEHGECEPRSFPASSARENYCCPDWGRQCSCRYGCKGTV